MTELTLDAIAEQERTLVFERFTLDDAWTIGLALRRAAIAAHAAVAIEITLRDRILFYSAVPGADIANANWVRRKRNTVIALGTSTLAVGMKLQKTKQSLEERYGLDPREHASDGGGFPLRLASLGCIGALTVSGMPSVDDHRLVTGVLDAFLRDAAG